METGTVPNVVFAMIRRLHKVDEILNECRRTRLVSRAVDGRTERGVRWVGGEWDCYCSCRCVCKDPEGLES